VVALATLQQVKASSSFGNPASTSHNAYGQAQGEVQNLLAHFRNRQLPTEESEKENSVRPNAVASTSTVHDLPYKLYG
jgi:hypothetical protein